MDICHQYYMVMLFDQFHTTPNFMEDASMNPWDQLQQFSHLLIFFSPPRQATSNRWPNRMNIYHCSHHAPLMHSFYKVTMIPLPSSALLLGHTQDKHKCTHGEMQMTTYHALPWACSTWMCWDTIPFSTSNPQLYTHSWTCPGIRTQQQRLGGIQGRTLLVWDYRLKIDVWLSRRCP